MGDDYNDRTKITDKKEEEQRRIQDQIKLLIWNVLRK